MQEEQMKQLTDSWAKVKALDQSFETQGVILFKNIFTIAPGALQLFSFKDEPDLYNSSKLKKHGKAVMTYVDLALDDFAGNTSKLQTLGKRHFDRGIQIPHYEVVG